MQAPTLALRLSGAFLALYLWQTENFLRRNRPGTYRPEALPKEVMPRL